ncbi:MAG: M3 family metallopeptidase, partial [Chloroflexota bacterium]
SSAGVIWWRASAACLPSTKACRRATAEEALAVELGASGASAWSKLHESVCSQIEVEVAVDGQLVRMPISEAGNLMLSPDREQREAAYLATQDAWQRWATPLAAALNGVKGTGVTLAGRRGWSDPVDVACFQNSIDRETLEVMLATTREAFPHFRRYFRAKARLIGVGQLAWFDLTAPVGDPGRSWEWLDAVGLLQSEFAAFSPGLGDLMSRAAAERWIDAGPRPGKEGGAFCSALRAGESRILMNFTPSFDGVSTLAHEMGHAYHNSCQADLEPLLRQTPSTLAETASTFCETLVFDSLLSRAEGSERLFMLDQALQTASQVAVDIISRYDFERALFRLRTAREATIPELCDLMTAAQSATYGDGLDPARMNRWAWVKTHYYSDQEPFYNFPYLFGQLFGLGLFAIHQREPEGFVPRYELLLRSTGCAEAADLAAGFGIDLRDAAFWRSSLDTIVRKIDQFEAMAMALAATA